MFSLTIHNDNALPVIVAWGHLTFAEGSIHTSGGKDVTLTSSESVTVVCDAETDQIAARLAPLRGEQDEPKACVLTVTNPNDRGVRVEYGDPETGDLDEFDLDPAETATIAALTGWRVTFALLGVTGKHAAPNDGYTEGNG